MKTQVDAQNRFLIHANVSFNSIENEYFRALLYALRPMYKTPSRYVICHTVMDSEAARIQILEEDNLSKRTNMTLLCDGWDDAAGRSVYATLAVEVNKPPVLLGLVDMTGQRTNVEAIIELNERNLASMNVNPLQMAGLCTDNPSTMIAMRREWERKYPRTIVSYQL